MFQTQVAENIKTRVLYVVRFFSVNVTVYGIMWKNTVERGRPQIITQYGAYAFYAGNRMLQTHDENI